MPNITRGRGHYPILAGGIAAILEQIFEASGSLHTPAIRAQKVIGKAATAGVKHECPFDSGGLDGRFQRRGGGAGDVVKDNIGVSVDTVTFLIHPGPQGNVFGGEEIYLVEPAQLLEYLRLGKKCGAIEGVGPEQTFAHCPLGPAGLIVEMEIAESIAPTGELLTTASLNLTVREHYFRRDDSRVIRELPEIGDKRVYHGRVDVGVIIDDEHILSPGPSQCQVIVLGESPDLITSHDLYPRELFREGFKVIFSEHVRDNKGLVRDRCVGPDALQTRTEEIHPVHTDYHYADLRIHILIISPKTKPPSLASKTMPS